MDTQRAELLRRPGIEEITRRYEEMQARTRDELAQQFPWLDWRHVEDGTKAGCTGFDEFSGIAESNTLDMWSAEGNIPDPDWPRAEQIVARITAEYGFTPPETVVSRPADHQIVGSDTYGAGYRFGTAKRTVLSGSTGCHLPQAEKDKFQNPS